MQVWRRQRRFEPELQLEGFAGTRWRERDPELQLEGYGAIGCGEFSVLKERLELLLRQAEEKGIEGSNAYISAKGFYDQHSGWKTDFVLLGSYCESAVREINDRIRVLSAELTSGGTPPVVVGPEIEPPRSADFESLIKWVIVGVTAVAGAWIVTATVVPRLLAAGKKRMSGSLAGHGRKRRKVRR